MQIIIVGLHVYTYYGLMVDLCVHTTATTKAPRESSDITTTVYPASDDCVSSISRGMYIVVLSEHSYL